MALGNYDLWLDNNEPENKKRFLTLANWLKANQDEAGGWKNPWNYLRPSALSNYSAMAQGEGISTLVRAYMLTEDISFLNQAQKAYNVMMRPLESGGCSFVADDNIYLEEYPEVPRSTVLNGWIYALFGVYDFMLLTKSEKVGKVLNKSLTSLDKSLESYDTGYWTYYDLHGTLCSPFYHCLHVSLLDALYLLTGIESFNKFSNKWAQYEKGLLNKNRALFVKAIQKLKNPTNVSITK